MPLFHICSSEGDLTMGKIRVIGGKDKVNGDYINTTSKSTNWSRGLSPFFLKDIELYNGYKAKNMENAWQFSKVYKDQADSDGNPTQAYFDWAINGWNSDWAFRYPMGKGAIPLYSFWDGQKLDYIQARKAIYLPLYAKSVVKTEAFKILKGIYEKEGNITLWDFDGYDYMTLGMTLQEVLLEPKRKMGHAFVLAMLLEGVCEVTSDNTVILHMIEQGTLF